MSWHNSNEETYDSALPAGHELQEYKIVSVLGSGGFAITYKALDVHLNRHVAIKEYMPASFAQRLGSVNVGPRTSANKEEFEWGRHRFLDEARTLAQFHHPSIVSVVRFFEAHGTAYIVMAYEEGEELGVLLKRMTTPPDEHMLVHQLLVPLLDGLEALHARGILHRDIKPDNIFIRKNNTPVLIDFGAARQDIEKKHSGNVTNFVSTGYSPLEQYGNAGKQGPWTDIYALAGTAYHAMTGKAPPEATDRVQGNPYISAGEAATVKYSGALVRGIDKALHMSPEKRPQSSAEFRDMILASGKPSFRSSNKTFKVDTDKTLRIEPPKKRTHNFRFFAAAGVGVAALLVGALLLGNVLVSGNDNKEKTKRGVIGAITKQTSTNKPPPEKTARTTPSTTKPSASTPTPAPTPTPTTKAAPTRKAPVRAATRSHVLTKPALSENSILNHVTITESIKKLRKNHISGALLAYIQTRKAFNDCVQTQCRTLSKKKQAMEKAALSGWRNGRYNGLLEILGASTTKISSCKWRIEVRETITFGNTKRSQKRSYCTKNGINRKVDREEPVV